MDPLAPNPDDPRLTEPVSGIDQNGNPVESRVVVERPSGGAVKGAPVGVSEMLAADKLALQNYGRPYNQAGQPTGTYYRYAKQAPLPEWS